MTVRDNKQLKILIALLVILGLTFFLGPQINRSPTASAVPAAQPKPETLPVANDARIRIDLVERSTESRPVGRENLFQYRIAPAAPAASVRPPAATDPFANPPAPNPVPQRPSGPPAPPPAPPINLKYQGYARTDATGAGITAFLVDESRHYNVTAGDVLMGRYRIVGINDGAVEVEDLQYNRRQTLPLLK